MTGTPTETQTKTVHDMWILFILCNPKFHFRLQKYLKLVTILIQFNPVHTLLLYFSNTHFFIFLPSTLVSSKCSFSFRFSSQNPPYIFLIHTLPHASHSPYSLLFNRTLFGED
jgi:hypothetical protein